MAVGFLYQSIEINSALDVVWSRVLCIQSVFHWECLKYYMKLYFKKDIGKDKIETFLKLKKKNKSW